MWEPTEVIPVAGRTSSELEWICRETLRAAFPAFRKHEVTASFYPYIGMTHTIRRRGQRWELRISDHCRRAPRTVLEAISVLLACKVLKRRAPGDMFRIYARFRQDSDIDASVRARRLERGRKIINGPRGRHHSLDEIYQEINAKYFNNEVMLDNIGWSRRPSWSRLGHFDVVHQTITISPVLDSKGVPRWVVAFLVYHEMLHAVFESAKNRGPNRHHPPEFRRAEEAHPDFPRARKFLNDYCRTRGKRIQC